MIRRIAIVAALGVVAAAAYLVLIRDEVKSPTLAPIAATAVIGSGDGAVGVGPDGKVMRGWPAPDPAKVPALPIDEPPSSGRLRGPVLEQARVLGAAPPALRPHIERSYLGESGVDVVLRSGIELRFGDAADATLKWRAAAAVLADPGTTELGYVNVHSPSRPTTGGSGVTLPAVP